MAGISSKAAGGLINNYKFNGIEFDQDFGMDSYEAFYRNLDPQIGRFWQIDPETESLENYSPYTSMYNNPISNVDPLGDFGSRFGAWWNRLWHGGGKIEQNEYGEWSVNKTTVETNESGETIVTGFKYYGEGRNKYTAAAEELAKDCEIMADIQMNGEKSMYQMYDSPQEAGNAALSLGTGVLLPSPIIRSGTIAINSAKASYAAKKTVERLLNAGKTLEKGGLNRVGRALQKHGDRAGSLFPKATGNPAIMNAQGEAVLTEIITNPSATTVTRHHARFGDVLEYTLPNGQGARFSADGKTFIGFIQ